jgi:anthranilate phosphoribosyltransferase
MAGGDAEENAAITRNILAGKPGAKRDVVLINAGAALMAAGKAGDLKAGIDMAAAAIDDGKATEKLNALVEYTQDNG